MLIRVKPKQSLGQNFLIDGNIARKIVHSLRLDENDVVVEIGPGHGALTQHLAGRVRHLLAIEIDNRVVGDLQAVFASEKVTILHQDFLDIHLPEWQHRYKSKLRLVGNIPYHLTSPILFKAFDEWGSIQDLTIMIQQEVAHRITAKPNTKKYGILAVLSQFYGIPKLLFNVSPNCIYPKPKVMSTVVYLRFHEQLPENINEKILTTIVKTTFGKRRKTLRNGLKYLPYDEPVIKKIIAELEFPLEKRPEQLSIHQFIQLSHQIESIITENR